MPEHTTFLTYLLATFPALQENAHNIGYSFIGHQEPTWRSFEPIITSLLVILLVVGLALRARTRLSDVDNAVVPDDKLTLRTFMEVFVGYFYGLAKDVMGPKRAKRYFSIVGGAACFVFFSNIIALIPGLAPPTSSLNITLGCALCVFIIFNFYGMQANGLGYFKHMAGPQLILAPLIFLIEVISMCVRPVTLSVRLMVNMAVDHLLGMIAIGIVALLVPIPLMFLGVIVILVQTLVFSLLTSIYIALATEHEEHN
jgi:F-type H+-transporting ATPase subunit a